MLRHVFKNSGIGSDHSPNAIRARTKTCKHCNAVKTVTSRGNPPRTKSVEFTE